MPLVLLIALPAGAGILAFRLRSDAWRRRLLLAAAAGHAALSAAFWASPRLALPAGVWLALDDCGLIFLSLTSLLFLAVSVSAIAFLRREGAGRQEDSEEGLSFVNSPEALFTGCLLEFLASLTLVISSRHFGLLWVALEATTLVTAPLIHYHRHHRSLEAAWKYLLICSVGIALALLGNFFLAAAAATEGGSAIGLTFSDLAGRAGSLDPTWLKAASILFLVGYGTKMGLAPMHVWLPDAHSEAPSPVSALLSGALLNGAFLALLRMQGVLAGAGLAEFGRELFLILGLLTMAAAALFMLSQQDFKRLLAYSSVESMGILAVGVGLGGSGDWGSLYHALNHSLIKASLFITAGNVLFAYRTKKVHETGGVLGVLPVSGVLWTAGFLAAAGFPPFGTFLSELSILRAAVESGRFAIAGLFSLVLAIAFIGLVSHMARMILGEAAGLNEPAGERRKEKAVEILPAVTLLAVSLVLGLVVPRFLAEALKSAVQAWGG